VNSRVDSAELSGCRKPLELARRGLILVGLELPESREVAVNSLKC
jgi:hypothetical protein